MKIKRCPFCGHKAFTYKNEYGNWHVMCKLCFAETMDIYDKGKTGAIEQWNMRYKKR